MCLDQLPDVPVKQVVGHVKPAALVQLLLVEEEAVGASKIADRTGRLGENVEGFG